MINTIIFDNNGVLTYSDAERTIPNFAHYFGISEEYLKSFFDEQAQDMDQGLITTYEFYQHLAKITGKPYDPNELKTIQINGHQPRPGMFELLEELKGKYKLVILTNFGDIFDECNEQIWHFERYFKPQNIFLSCKMKMRKPEPEIYKICLNSLGCKPEEVVFIDDREQNLGPAKKLGMQTILFKTPEKLTKELDSLLK